MYTLNKVLGCRNIILQVYIYGGHDHSSAHEKQSNGICHRVNTGNIKGVVCFQEWFLSAVAFSESFLCP